MQNSSKQASVKEMIRAIQQMDAGKPEKPHGFIVKLE